MLDINRSGCVAVRVVINCWMEQRWKSARAAGSRGEQRGAAGSRERLHPKKLETVIPHALTAQPHGVSKHYLSSTTAVCCVK